METIALVCGIVSIVLGFLGAILFGVPSSLIAVILGVVAVVIGIKIKNESNQQKGNGAFITGIIGLIFGVVFTIGCAIAGSCSGSYGCYGCVGGTCSVSNDINKAIDNGSEEINDIVSELQNLDFN